MRHNRLHSQGRIRPVDSMEEGAILRRRTGPHGENRPLGERTGRTFKMNQEQLAALDLLCGYISFGLAIYAITSLCGLLFVRYKLSVFPHLTRKIARYYGGVIVLIVLEMSRQIWDSLYLEHFPLV